MQNFYVDTPATLRQLCVKLQDAAWLAVDTEFHRENTYYPKLCLLQIATEDLIACIDALALSDISSLLDILYEPCRVKVFHASRQDLEIFYHLRNIPLKPVFDSQLAAPLLGYQDQIGYASLVHQVLGKTLNKEQTRTDWRQRPLSHQQLEYAANDVIYLGQIYLKFRHLLEQQGKLQWLAGDFANLYKLDEYETAPQDAWLRLKNAYQLEGEQLAVLQALAEWRETAAQQINQPRNWIIRDETLFNIALALPKEAAELMAVPTLSDKTATRYGAQFLALITEARNKPALPVPMKCFPVKRLEKDEAVQVNQLLALVHERSDEYVLDPKAVTSRRELSRLLRGETDLRILRGWRRQFIGEELLARISSRDLHPEGG